MKSLRDTPDRSGRSLLLATAASVASIVISVYLDESTGREPVNPIIHPVIATAAASIAFWVTYPRRNLVKLWLFMPIAFAVISIISMMVAISMGMPS